MLGLCIFGSALSEKSLVPNKLSEKFTDFSKNQPLEIMWMALSECFSTRVILKKKKNDKVKVKVIHQTFMEVK